LKYLQPRFLSVSVLAGLGFLLIVSLAVEAGLDTLGEHLKGALSGVTVVVFYIFNAVVSFAVIALLFAIIFKVLPDVRIKWKDVIAVAVATAVLFMLGKSGISFYIGKSSIGTTYGTA